MLKTGSLYDESSKISNTSCLGLHCLSKTVKRLRQMGQTHISLLLFAILKSIFVKSSPQGKNQHFTIKPVLSGHSKIEKAKVFKTNGSLMKV